MEIEIKKFRIKMKWWQLLLLIAVVICLIKGNVSDALNLLLRK